MNSVAFDANKAEMDHLKKLAVGEANTHKVYKETAVSGQDFKTVDFHNQKTGEHRIAVSDGQGNSMVVSSLGATLTNFHAKPAEGAEGAPVDVVLGFDSMEEYEA